MRLQIAARLAQGSDTHADLLDAFLNEQFGHYHAERHDYQIDHMVFVDLIKRGHAALAPFKGGLEGIRKPMFDNG